MILLTPVLVLSLAGGCPPQTPHSAVDPKFIVDSARTKDLPNDVEALRSLADKTAADLPEDPAAHDHALAAVELALDKRRDDYDLLWRASRACFLVTEYVKEKDKSGAYAAAGRDYGERAIKEKPKGVEGHYYLALNIAKMAEAKKNLRLLKPAVAAAESAAKINPSYDNAGPLRFMGKVYITAPAWPMSIGAPDKAVQVLERAVALAPVPLNRLFLGQAYFHEEEFGKAKEALEQALRDGKGKLHQRWQKEGEDYLRRLKAKTSS